MKDNKEFARQMRENCVANENGVIMVSKELWETIADRVENSVYITHPTEKGGASDA